MSISNESNIYSYIGERISNGDIGYLSSYKKHFKKKNILFKSLIDYLFRFNLKRYKRYEIIILGNRFNDMYKYLDDFYDCLFLQLSLKESVEFFNKKKYYKNFNNDLLKLVDNYYENDNIKGEKLVSHIFNKINKFLVNVNPKLLILWNDSLPLERAFLYCAKKLNIKTITIQHGLFQFSNPSINDGYYSDYFLTWGNYTREKYIEYGIKDEEHMYILGYPYKIDNDIDCKKNTILSDNSRVCFLGQEFRKNKENLKVREYNLINDIKIICEELDIKFIYRPHPGEDFSELKKIVDGKITKGEERLIDTINNYDIFISINSTALIEAALNDKICTEILFEGVLPYNYENAGACYTIKNNIDEIRKFLTKCINNDIKPMKVSANYIHVYDEPGERLIKIIEGIVHN